MGEPSAYQTIQDMSRTIDTLTGKLTELVRENEALRSEVKQWRNNNASNTRTKRAGREKMQSHFEAELKAAREENERLSAYVERIEASMMEQLEAERTRREAAEAKAALADWLSEQFTVKHVGMARGEMYVELAKHIVNVGDFEALTTDEIEDLLYDYRERYDAIANQGKEDA